MPEQKKLNDAIEYLDRVHRPDLADVVRGLMVQVSGIPASQSQEYPDAIKTWPERIWLQNGENLEMPEYSAVFESAAEVTWCQDHIEDADVPYIRADLMQSIQSQPAPQDPSVEKVRNWQAQAIAWLRGKAAAQAQTNEQYPRHAACYPTWVERVAVTQRLADELEYESKNALQSQAKQSDGSEG